MFYHVKNLVLLQRIIYLYNTRIFNYKVILLLAYQSIAFKVDECTKSIPDLDGFDSNIIGFVIDWVALAIGQISSLFVVTRSCLVVVILVCFVASVPVIGLRL